MGRSAVQIVSAAGAVMPATLNRETYSAIIGFAAASMGQTARSAGRRALAIHVPPIRHQGISGRSPPRFGIDTEVLVPRSPPAGYFVGSYAVTARVAQNGTGRLHKL